MSATNSDFLAAMAASSRVRVARARAIRDEASLRQLVAKVPPPPSLTLSAQRFDLIAELKLRSPAAGQLRKAENADVVARVQAYAAAGAAAVSVLEFSTPTPGVPESTAPGARELAFALYDPRLALAQP